MTKFARIPAYAPGVAMQSLTSAFLAKLAQQGNKDAAAELAARMVV